MKRVGNIHVDFEKSRTHSFSCSLLLFRSQVSRTHSFLLSGSMLLFFGIFSVDPTVTARLTSRSCFPALDTSLSQFRISVVHERVECAHDSKDQILCRDIALLTRFQTRWLRFI